MRAGRATLLFLIPLLLVVRADATTAPDTDVTAPSVHVPDRVHPGVVIFVARDGRAHAVATDGTTLHTWAVAEGRVIGYARPLADGTILARLETPERERIWIAVLDRDSNILLEIEEPEGLTFHHDHSALPNGNYLVLCSQLLERPEISPLEIQDDCVVELDSAGNIVWKWQSADHFDEFEFSPLTESRIAEHGGDWAHANAATAIPEDIATTDPRFQPGNVVISYRSLDAIVVVDRETGEIVWQTHGLTIGQHDSHFIGADLPGAGNILVFDNGMGGEYGDRQSTNRFYSRVVEIDPVTSEIVWEYTASLSGRAAWTFYSWFISGAERLPNGNTLITEGAFGTIFEVTPSGEIVWEYTTEIVGPSLFGPSNHVYRAHKVAPDWPGL